MFNPGESIIVVIRRHWLVFALRCFILALGAILPLVVSLYIPAPMLEALAVIPSLDLIFTFLYLCWLLILWQGAFAMWTNYYLDIWIVTGDRLIDIDQKSLFKREITTTRLEKIQDVTVSVSGLLATLFGFGNITIHTAGDNPDIVIRTAAHPQQAKEKILHAHGLAVGRVGQSPDKVS